MLMLLGAVPAGGAAAYDLTIESVVHEPLSLTPDVTIDFDDLAPGTLLQPGDPIAPGVTFGGTDFLGNPQAAIVVDQGAGDRALQQRNVGTLAMPLQSDIFFSFANGVRAVGADVDAPGSTVAGCLCPTSWIFDGSGDALGFAGVGGSVMGFFGWQGTEASTPIRALQYGYVYPDLAAEGLVVDDLAVLFAPEPGASAAWAAALSLALLSAGCVPLSRDAEHH